MAKPKAPATPADGGNKPIRHLYLIDGSGYIFRAYHALPPMNRPDGTPVNAVFGFCRMLTQLLDDPEVDHVAVILDADRACPLRYREFLRARRQGTRVGKGRARQENRGAHRRRWQRPRAGRC